MTVHLKAWFSLGLLAGLSILVQACLPLVQSQAASGAALDGAAPGSPSELGIFSRCGGVFGMCGYEDREGNERIAKTFEKADNFSEGLAAVQMEGRQGYIDASGKTVIPLKFDLAGQFHNGLAEVVIGGKAGLIDRRGDFVLQPAFARAIPLTDHVAIVQSGVFGRGRGSLGRPDDFQFEASGLAGLYDLRKGPQTAEIYKFSRFDDGNHFVWAKGAGGSDLIGLMRLDGSWQVEPQFKMTETLNDERAVVTVDAPGSLGRSQVWGAVDGQGRLVVPLKFAWLSYWRNGFTMARLNTPQGIRSGIIGRDGQLYGGRLFDDATSDGYERATVKIEGKWFLIHSDGRLSDIPPDAPVERKPFKSHAEAEPRGHCGGGVLFLPQDGLWGLRKSDGTVLVPPRYEAVMCFQSGVTWVPDEVKHAWCPLRPNGRPVAWLDCQTEMYAELMSDSVPECLDADPFRNSVLWTRKYLAHAVDPKQPAAGWISIRGGGGCRAPVAAATYVVKH